MADITVVNAVHSHDPRVPLGPLYLCSSLEAQGYEVDFRDYQVCDDEGLGTPDQFQQWLTGAAPVVAFSTLSSSLPLILASLSRKEMREKLDTVILGGPGVSSLGREILGSFPGVDIIASGEGERTLVECLQRLGNGGSMETVAGITYRDHGRIRVNPNRQRIENLDALPFPAYRHINLDDYTARTDFERIPLAILSARGCPYTCTFCDIPGIWRGGIRYRSVPNVIQELEELKEAHQLPRFHITDDTFVLGRERLEEFCKTLKGRRLDMPWSCLGRVDRMDEDLLRTLADANCDTIFYGIESGNDAILERIRKGFTVSQALEVVKASLAFMKTHVSFIWGFPFESLDELYDTIITLLVMHSMGAEPHLNLLVPLPSSEIHRTFGGRRQSLKAWEIGWDWAMMENYEYRPELHHLIDSFPGIFAPFFCLESPDFDRKVQLLASWGLTGGNPRASGGDGASQIEGTGPSTSHENPPVSHEVPPPRTHGLTGGLVDGPTLPGVSHAVLRRIGHEHYLLNTRDCNLYRAGPRTVELFRACQRGDELEDAMTTLRGATGSSPEAAREFIRKMLQKFAERGFLTRGGPC